MHFFHIAAVTVLQLQSVIESITGVLNLFTESNWEIVLNMCFVSNHSYVSYSGSS